MRISKISALGAAALLSSVLTLPAQAQSGAAAAPVAGGSVLGVSVSEVAVVASGWSAKKAILGKAVHNDEGKSIGTIEDLIIAPDKAVSYAIIGVGGFLGIAKHDVAIPVNQLRIVDKKLTLPGATKDALKALPEFEYAKH